MELDTAIGLVGTVVSIAGFIFTIYQLRKTQNASEAVKVAVEHLRGRSNVYDQSTELLKASRSLSYCVKFLKLKKWQDAADALLEAHVGLNRVNYLSKGDESLNIQLNGMDVLEIVAELEEAFEKSLNYENKSLLMIIRKAISEIDNQHILKNQELVSHG